jgi:hypothetical protein
MHMHIDMHMHMHMHMHIHILIHTHVHMHTHIHSHGAVFQGVAALLAYAHMSAGVQQMAVSMGIQKQTA